MKTDCIKIDECRKPLQLCNGKCKDYKTKKDLQKINEAEGKEV